MKGTTRFSIALAGALGLAAAPDAWAAPAPLWLVPEFGTDAPEAVEPVDGQLVRVLVFPHLTSNPPQGMDPVVDRVVLSTEGECEIRNVRSSVVQERFQRREFTVQGLSRAVAIDCDRPLKIERASNLTSYRYTGSFIVRAKGSKTVEVINVLPMEEYLRGVVPIEMPVSWPLEALKAQAVAARTYAWFHVGHARKTSPRRGWDMDDTVQYQAYTGIENRDARTDRAIEESALLSLFFENEIIQAFFSADSGGHTEDAHSVWSDWGILPYCRAKPEFYTDEDLDLARWGPWRVSLSWGELTRRLRNRKVLPANQSVRAIDIREDELTASGRVGVVHAIAEKSLSRGRLVPSALRLDPQAFRRALGLRSTLFRVESMDGAGITLVGRGYGHGVGMSQVGAMTQASRYGKDFREILEFYYSGIDLREKR